jgi:hypothetical protein
MNKNKRPPYESVYSYAIPAKDERGRHSGADTYDVHFQFNDAVRFRMSFFMARRDKSEGEKLVAKILNTKDHTITRILRAKNGIWSDGPDGEPASQRFYPNGNLRHEFRAVAGKAVQSTAIYIDYDQERRPCQRRRALPLPVPKPKTT